jgi:hypothetical protein
MQPIPETEADKAAQHKLSENEPCEFEDELIDVGIDGSYLAEKLKEEFEAEETKFFAEKGKVIDEKDVIAWGIRQKARMDTHKLRGDYPAEEQKHTFNDLPTMTLVVREMMKEKDGSG